MARLSDRGMDGLDRRWRRLIAYLVSAGTVPEKLNALPMVATARMAR